MATDPPHDDIKAIWRDQKTETISMPTAELRLKAEKMQTRIRWRNGVEYAASVVVVAAFGYGAWRSPFPLVQFGCLLVVLGTFVLVYQLHRRGSAVEPPVGVSASQFLSFHREQLARQRDALRSVALWYIGPLLPGLAVLMTAPVFSPKFHDHWLRFALGCVPVVVIIVGVWLLNRWAARRLQTQIDALDTMREGD